MSQSVSPKNVLVHAYFHLNLGDDLFLKILTENFPEVRFILLADAKTYQSVFPTANIGFLSYPRNWSDKRYVKKVLSKFFKPYFLKLQFDKKKDFLKTMKKDFDAVVTIGGSIFMENKDARINSFSTHRLFSEVFSDTPKFIIGANFGPFKNKSFLDSYRNLLQNYTDVSFRDSYSRNLFADAPNVRFSPDLVFSGKFSQTKTAEKTVGFSIMNLAGRPELQQYKDEYYNLITNTITDSVSKGYMPYLFSFCKFEGDEIAINEILHLLNPEVASKVQSVLYTGNIDEYLQIYSSMEVMYATRFHAMILSMLFQQKMHPLVYSNKMLQVLDDMNYHGHYTDLRAVPSSADHISVQVQNKFELNTAVIAEAKNHFSVLEKFI